MKKLLGLLLVPFLLYSCDIIDFGKSESGYLDYLPKKTQEGANTFGCYINGELAASQDLFQKEGIKSGLEIGFVNGFWSIYSRLFNEEKVDTTMRFDIEVQQASLIIKYDSLHRGKYECEVYIRFRGKSGLAGSVITTTNITRFDHSSQIISGDLDALDIPLYKSDSVVHLRKIRFDIKYGTNF